MIDRRFRFVTVGPRPGNLHSRLWPEPVSLCKRCLARRAAVLVALIALCGIPPSTFAADAVLTWSLLATSDDDIWDAHATTLMHAAMHDTLNAINPRYTRWTAPTPGEPSAAEAAPEAAVAAAAYSILMELRSWEPAHIEAAFQSALAKVPESPRKTAGIALGKAIANATLAHRAGDTKDAPLVPLTQSNKPGHWRATPPDTSAEPMFTRSLPFSGAAALALPVPNPPELGSPVYLAAVAEVRSLGRKVSTARSSAQTEAALFFARQSSHRNFLNLAIRLLAAKPAPQDIWDSARTMTLMSIALSDSFIVTVEAKERFHFWRPITAIREGGFGVTPVPNWEPLVSTPEHPDHPSGHAAECTAGATVLRLLLGTDVRPVRYVATDVPLRPVREYPGFTAIADECAASRVWAGVHFRTADDAGQLLGEAVANHVVGSQLRPLGVQ